MTAPLSFFFLFSRSNLMETDSFLSKDVVSSFNYKAKTFERTFWNAAFYPWSEIKPRCVPFPADWFPLVTVVYQYNSQYQFNLSMFSAAKINHTTPPPPPPPPSPPSVSTSSRTLAYVLRKASIDSGAVSVTQLKLRTCRSKRIKGFKKKRKVFIRTKHNMCDRV